MNMNIEQNDEIEIDLRKILGMFKGKIIIILLAGMIIGAAAFVASKCMIVPQYSSTTKLYVLNRANDGTTTLTDLQTSTQLTKDYQILVTSAPVMQEVIKKLKLDMTAQQLAAAVTVTTPSETRVLNITMKNPDPYKAKEIVDAVAEASSEQICKIMQIEQVNVIEEGGVSTTPVESATKKNTIIGFIAGVVIACAVVVIRTLLDDSLKSAEDIERYLGISTLAMIPVCEEMDDGRNKKGKKNKKKRKTSQTKKTGRSEA